MAKLSGDSAGLRENFRRERSQFIAVFLVASKGEHFRAQTHELDAVFVVPAQHLDNVSSVGQPQFLNKLLAAGNVGWLILVWSVLGGVFRLRGVRERMAVLYDGSEPTGSRTEDGRDSLAEIRVKTGL